MRIFAVLAHHNKDSLTAKLFYKTVEHLAANGHFVDVLNLYEHADRIPFYIPPATMQPGDDAKFDFYFENKERFMAADRLLLAYPVYWYAVPGILKCWLDLISNYAWKTTGSYYQTPRHHIKKALVINTAGMSWFFRFFCTRNSATEMIKQSLKFLSINNFYFYEIGSSHKLTTKKIDRHLKKILSKGDWLAS